MAEIRELHERLIDNLLESVRIESGQLEIRRRSVDLDGLGAVMAPFGWVAPSLGDFLLLGLLGDSSPKKYFEGKILRGIAIIDRKSVV